MMEKGKAEAVVIDAVEGIRRGLVQAKKGIGRSVDEVFDSIEEDAEIVAALPQPKTAC